VVEVASNDGYLLGNYLTRGIDVLGVEPARNVAEVAREAGVPTEVRFFDVDCARDLAAAKRQADLLIGTTSSLRFPT
jgi:hypothetical protein